MVDRLKICLHIDKLVFFDNQTGKSTLRTSNYVFVSFK